MLTNKQLLTYTTNINDITFETSDKELPNGMNILNVIIKKDIKISKSNQRGLKGNR